MLRTLVTSVALALALAPVLQGCTSGSSDPDADPAPSASPTTTETTPPDPGPRPKVGECHALTFRQAASVVGNTEPVACTKPHTAETYLVARLELATRAGKMRRVDSRAAQRQARSACTSRLSRHLGRTPRELRLSMAQAVWFTPGPKRAEAGADWFRCDVVVVASEKQLLRLPRRTQGWGGAPAIAMCATAAPGTKAFRRVTCGAQHSWVAVTTVDIPGGAKLPGRDAIADRMEAPCRDAARARAGDPLDFSWSQEIPTAEQWAAGRRYGICWVPA